MAVVYLAHDEELHRRVAIKVLAEHLAGDDSFRARFLQESKLASRLSHPNVVQVYDAGEAEGSPYIVMEYVPGRHGRASAESARTPKRCRSRCRRAPGCSTRTMPASSIETSSRRTFSFAKTTC